MAFFWIKIFAFAGVLAVLFGISGSRLRQLIFRKGQHKDEQSN